MKPEVPRVSIVIPNWNGCGDTIECLESLYQMDYSNFDVVIVDNGSKDDSLEKIKNSFTEIIERYDNEKRFSFTFISTDEKGEPINSLNGPNDHPSSGGSSNQLVLVSNDKNLGFAKGINIGLEIGLERLYPDYFLLLNNDLVVDKRLIPDLLEMADKEENAGVIGPTVYHYSDRDKVQSMGSCVDWTAGKVRRIMIDRTDEKWAQKIEVDFVSGCCMLMRSSLVRRIGLFRPEYFAYWEEVEWCTRAKKNGAEVLVAPKAKVWHKGSVTSNKISGFYIYHNTRNMFWFLRSYQGTWAYRRFLMYFFIARFGPISGVIVVRNRSLREYSQFLKGIKDGITRGS